MYTYLTVHVFNIDVLSMILFVSVALIESWSL